MFVDNAVSPCCAGIWPTVSQQRADVSGMDDGEIVL